MAVATADYDNDGYTDIFVAGANRNILYRNRGNGTFEDVTQKAGLAVTHPKYGKMWATSAGWLDYNNDGRLDLFVSNYVVWNPRTEPHCGAADQALYCHPDNYQGLPNQLFRNNGDGTFTDVSTRSGIGNYIGKGMGVAFADVNGDGKVDFSDLLELSQHYRENFGVAAGTGQPAPAVAVAAVPEPQALGLYALLTMERLNEEQRTMYIDVFGGPHLLGTYFDDSWLAPTYWITCSRTTRRRGPSHLPWKPCGSF